MQRNFHDIFHRMPTFFGEAHGRVNIIGEHTDYNGGFVLPTPIPHFTRIDLCPRNDARVHIVSFDVPDIEQQYEYAIGSEAPNGKWHDFFQGITQLLKSMGYKIEGFDALVTSTIPLGAGLASSAAILVASFRALRTAFSLPLSDMKIAELSQKVENNFVGAKVGIMDHMVSSLVELGTALFVDTRDLSYKKIPLPLEKAELFVINSGIRHSNLRGNYKIRRQECEQASLQLHFERLRDVGDLGSLNTIPDLLAKRVRHIFTENARVIQAVDAIDRGSVEELGKLMTLSHISMRDDFEISIPEIDFLVEAALVCPEIYGARLTGGGFGGSIVGLCKKGSGRRVADGIVGRYQIEIRGNASVILPVNCGSS